MSGAELHKVEPGHTVGYINYALGGDVVQKVCTLQEGIIPAQSPLAGEGATAFVASDPEEGPQAVVVLEHGQGALKTETLVAIEPLNEGGAPDVEVLRGLVQVVLKEEDPHAFEYLSPAHTLTRAVLDPATVEAFDASVCEELGFAREASGSFVYPPFKARGVGSVALAA